MSTGARQEGHGAVEVDREAALDLVEDLAFDLLAGVELDLELDPALLAARLVARQDGFAQRVLDALDVDVDDVADLQGGLAALLAEFLEGDAALDLQTGVDDGHVLLDRDDRSLDHGAFGDIVLMEGRFEKRGEIVARNCCVGHSFSLRPRLYPRLGASRRGFVATGPSGRFRPRPRPRFAGRAGGTEPCRLRGDRSVSARGTGGRR